MALRIRLARHGAKKRPHYRIVVADSRSPRDGRFIETLGTYNPLLPKDHEERVKLKTERVQHWLENGARPSDRVARFLGAAGLAEAPKRHNPERAKPKARAQERLKALEEAKAAPAEEAPSEETPAEEAPAEAASEEGATEAQTEEEEKTE